MVPHPLILGPKLIFLIVIVVVLFVLHGYLTPAQFRAAVIIAVVAFVSFSIALWIVALRILSNPESNIHKQMVLSRQARAQDGFQASADEFASLVGDCGVALSALRPSGIALFGKRRVPVMTEGEFVSAGSAVEVVAAKGSKVIVRSVAESADGGQEEPS